jgi:hypothetical protein
MSSMIERWIVDSLVKKAVEKLDLTDEEESRLRSSVNNLLWIAENVIQRSDVDQLPP